MDSAVTKQTEPDEQISSRMRRSFRATLVNQAVSFVSVFVLQFVASRTWGADTYFDWSIIISVPAYLTLGDFGFGTATVSEITQLIGRGDKERAKVVYQSTWLSVTAITCLLALLMFAVLPFFDATHVLKLTSTPRWEAQVVMAVFGLNALLSQQGTFILAGYQTEHHFARYQYTQSIQKLLETVVLVIGVSLPPHMVGLALAVLASRFVVYAVSTWDMWRLNDWLRPGFKHFQAKVALDLIRPAAFVTLYSAASIMSVEGFAQAVSGATGAVAGGILSSSRKLARVSNQVVGGLGVSTGVEFSRLYGAGDIPTARSLVVTSTQKAFWIALAFLPTVMLLGPPFYHFWTKTKTIDLFSLTAMLLAALVNALWSQLASALFSINRTAKISLAYSAVMLLACLATFFSAKNFGIQGAATTMFLAEVAMVCLVLPVGCQVIEERPIQFLTQVIKVPESVKRKLPGGSARRDDSSQP